MKVKTSHVKRWFNGHQEAKDLHKNRQIGRHKANGHQKCDFDDFS